LCQITMKVKPEVYTRYLEKEHKGKEQPEVAKPHGIERKGEKFKVFLDIEGKRCHIGYYKTLDAAKEALKKAREDAKLDEV